MAHEISIRASGRAEMAYVGDVPWHGLGQSVTKGASIDVWRREAGLDWEAKAAPVQYRNEDGLLLPFDSRKVLYRSDTCQPLGDVSEKFKVVQPRELLEFFRDLTEAGGWHIETAGALRGGSKIWALADCGIEGKVAKRDKVKGKLLVATSLDGSMKTTAKFTSVRVVCANTIAVALNSETDGQVTVSHRSHFDHDEVKDSLGISVDSFKLFMHKCEEMSETPVGLEEATEVLRDLFGRPTSKEIKETSSDYEFQKLMSQFTEAPGQKLREQRSVTRSLALFGGEGMGSQLPGSVGTRWGLLNAITQHVDHELGRTPDTRMDSAWFGRGDEIKRAALDMLEVA